MVCVRNPLFRASLPGSWPSTGGSPTQRRSIARSRRPPHPHPTHPRNTHTHTPLRPCLQLAQYWLQFNPEAEYRKIQHARQRVADITAKTKGQLAALEAAAA